MKRVITGILVGAAWLAAIVFLPKWAMCAVLAVMSCLCQREFYGLMRLRGYEVCPKLGMALGTVWIALVSGSRLFKWLYFTAELLMLFLPLVAFVLFVWVLFDPKAERPMERAGTTLLGMIYLPFMLSFFIPLAGFRSDPGWWATAMYLAAVVKFSDTGAYAAGMLFGRHKMFPRVSPKKTWEGFAGSIVTGMAVSAGAVALIRYFGLSSFVCPLVGLAWWEPLVLGAGLALVGCAGDLIESLFKREANVKDSAALLPGGGGGFLDMFDSLVFTPVFLVIYLMLSELC